MDININPFSTGNPMTIKDAAIVATIGAFVTMVLTNIANLTLGQIRADAMQVLFDLGKTYIVSWAGTFVTLAGLEQLIKRGQ